MYVYIPLEIFLKFRLKGNRNKLIYSKIILACNKIIVITCTNTLYTLALSLLAKF